ncbi:uncharacterized protein LOC115878528 [Sitophilus oryzae]|uniref:Uncharacterized protein LOC115878528 n=1 Tax=Sitophilus oryzae TaxID=7048 RepID=A0A6J2XHZ0_SITOR|nr:uncharacterized protein LOC115878528 [Sitophilus oryzae]
MAASSGGSIGPPKKFFKYTYKDSGPYLVIVETSKEDEEVTQNLGNLLHPMCLERWLKEFGIIGVNKVSRKGKNRVGIEFSSWNAANELFSSKLLKERNPEAYIPPSLVSCKGVARGVYKNIEMEEIVSERRTGPKIIEARRLQRKIIVDGTAKYIDTESVIITLEGKIIPRSIKIEYCEVRVDVYVSPVIMCFNCMRYGHSKTQCRSKQRCSKCAE